MKSTEFEITQEMSPYHFAKKLGIRPQMVYNYINSKPPRIKASKNSLGKWVISAQDGTTFGRKYLERKELRSELGY